MKKNNFLYPFILFAFSLVAQKEASQWYFGNKAALDFNTQPPQILNNSAMITTGGSGSVSDASGSLLFYTDGLTVYNKQHLVIANGSGLLGNAGNMQQALTVQQPGNPNLYYIFTTDAPTLSTVATYYSIVDMSLAAGLGSVTVLNAPLMTTPGTEKICAVRHCNGSDVWIILHEYTGNKFRSYLLTSAGVNTTTPVISAAGATYVSNGQTAQGNIKVSPNGRQLSVLLWGTPNANSFTFELFDFDKSTGSITYNMNLGQLCLSTSSEFSPDGTKLYANGCSKYIFQWDLCAGSASAILASKDTVGQSSNSSASLGGMQKAIDGKIYVARSGSSSFLPDLGVINNPNALGSACNYVDLGQSVAPNACGYSFPNHINDRIKAPLSYTQQASCPSVQFAYPGSTVSCAAPGSSPFSYTWSFGDPASGTANTSNSANPLHLYSTSGTYPVKLVINYGSCVADTLKTSVTVVAIPNLTLSGKPYFCKNQSTTLTVSGANTYSWSTGAQTSSIVLSPTITTVYTVTGSYTNNVCSSSKVVTVTVNLCVGISENTLSSQELLIYPNPCSDKIFVECISSSDLEIYDPLGRLVLLTKTEQGKNEIDLRSLHSGFYLIKIKNQEGINLMRVLKTE